MSHLSPETLARLADETPTPLEAAHLETCDACRAELAEMHRLSAELAALPPLDPPPEAWAALEARLSREGLTTSGAAASGSAGRGLLRGPGGWPRLARLAASVVALLGAAAAGAAVQAHRDAAPTLAAAPPAAVEDGDVAAALTGAPVRSAREAERRLRATESAYLSALTAYNAFVPESAEDPSARLAALETIIRTTGAAMDRAPADPVINGYHLTALAQREATLRRLAAERGPWF